MSIGACRGSAGIPAYAGMTVMGGGVPAYAGMTVMGGGVPAYAGMTVMGPFHNARRGRAEEA